MQGLLIASAAENFGIAIAVVAAVVFIIGLLMGAFTVEQQTRAIVERFGRFKKTCGPGLHFKFPFIDRVAGRVTHRVRELEVDVESKTADDVFVDLKIAVQFFVREEEDTVLAAHYKLMNPAQQIKSYVFDTVRSLVPEMPVDHVFSEKEKIAKAVKGRLEETMQNYGYTIVQSLVNDIQPDQKVKEAMNHVNATARLKEAAKNEAEARKISTIAAAEAEARAKELQGVGIARQRLAIANGLKESVAACSEAGISPEEATKMVLLTQHYDTVTAVGTQSKATIMMVPYSPDGMNSVGNQITAALLTTAESAKPPVGEPGSVSPRPQAVARRHPI